jgi:putative transposase
VDRDLNKSGLPLVFAIKQTPFPHGKDKPMRDDSDETIKLPIEATATDVLTDLLRTGARQLLAQAIEAEVQSYIEQHADQTDEQGHRLVVRNGYLPERQIQTGIGLVDVRQPRVNDKRVDEQGRRFRFSSTILPKYLRRSKSLDELIPWLYLKGVSSGDFAEALAALLGKSPANLSANTVMRLKAQWILEWDAWSKRSLEGTRYVYFWVDGIYFNIRLEEPDGQRQCILVIMGATDTGRKELVAISDGYREGEQCWLDLLRQLKERGLEAGPELAIGDGALGFWKALRQVYPTTRQQRCWVHKTANVLNKLPRSQQPLAKQKLQSIWMAPTAKQANAALDDFVRQYQPKHPKAAECLEKDRESLLAFYDYPAEHWVHLRTTNPMESTFATVRLRTAKTKGAGSRQACLTMVFKLCQSAQKHWRLLNGRSQLLEVIDGVKFTDGIKAAA